jgi:hypothetical protein
LQDSSPTTTYTARRYGVVLEAITVKPGQSHSDAWQLVNDSYHTGDAER